jgi:hypothetical protein
VETGWNPLPIQINTIDISYTAPVTVAGPRYGEVVTSASAGQARITINQQPYDPEKRREYTGSGRDTRVNEDGTFDGQLSFLLSTDGTKFDEVVMGRNNQNSMQPVDASNISVEDLLRDLGRAMFETEHMLQVPDDLSSLQNV